MYRQVSPQRDSGEDISGIRVSTQETGVLNYWRVSGVKDYGSRIPTPKLVCLKLLCICKSSVVVEIGDVV